MTSRNVTIQNNVGLHARPATFFIQKANTYQSSIWVEKEDRIVNAKSLLGVFSLDLSGPLVLRLHGQPDAGLEEALREYGSPRTCSSQHERD